MDYLEREQLNYIMVARMYPNVKNAVWGLDDWIELTKGIKLNEMIFNHTDGKPRRYIVIKKKVEDRPKAIGKLLFDDLPSYRFSCFVTHLDLPLDQVWNIYNTRADCENRIKELKEDFWLRKLLFKRLLGYRSLL